MHIKTVTQQRSNKVTIYNKRGYLYLSFMLDGKRRQKALKMEDTSKNRKIVGKEIIPQLQKKIALGEYGQNEESKTFKYYSEFFLEQKRKVKSFKDKEPCFNKVIEFFGKYDVNKISRFTVKKYLESLNIKNKSKIIYKSTIKDILDLAIDDGAIKENVALNIKFTGKDSFTKIKYFQKEEVIQLLENAKEPLKTYLNIAFNTGMRPEEILAIKYIDIKHGYLNIYKTKRDGKIYQVTKTKGSIRTIPFHIDISHCSGKSFFPFSNIPDVSFFRRQWATLLKKCGIEHRGIYNTRHTFATHLLKDGVVSINELSGLLGHTKVSTTLSYYASAIDSRDSQVKEKLLNFGYHSVTQDKNSTDRKVE